MFGQWRPCEICGHKFMPKYEDQWACSDYCKMQCVTYDEDNGYMFNDEYDTYVEYAEKSRYKRIRSSHEYQLHKWRISVFERDGACVACGSTYLLNAHHIVPYHVSVDLRYEVDNGITLCQECHNEFHRTYGRTRIGKREIDEFIDMKCNS